MASQRLTAVYGMSPDEVIETIGPRQDPDIPHCMAMLVDPSRWSGCTVARFECVPGERRSETGLPRFAIVQAIMAGGRERPCSLKPVGV